MIRPTEKAVAPLNGLRTLASISIVVGHTWVLGAWSVPDVATALAWVVDSGHAVWAQSLWLSVDTFFFLSGFLFPMNRAMISPLRVLAVRFARLVVLYWLIATLQKYAMGMNDVCYGWDMTLLGTLFVSRPANEFCQPLGWSTQVDFMSWMFLVFLVVITSRLKISLEKSVVLAMIGSILLRFVLWIHLGEPSFIRIMTLQVGIHSQEQVDRLTPVLGSPAFDWRMMQSAAAELSRFEPMYFWTSTRVTPILMGFWLQLILRKGPVRQSSLFVIGGILLTGFVLWFNPFAFGGRFVFGKLYQTLFREVFCLGLSLIVVSVCTNQSDFVSRAVNWILSSRVLQLVAPFTYAVYLVHAFLSALVWVFLPPFVTDGSMTPSMVLLKAAMLYLASLGVAIPLTLWERRILKIVDPGK